MKSLFATLYPDPSDSEPTPLHAADEDEEAMVIDGPVPNKGVEGVGVKVVANSLEELKEPDKSNAQPAVKILAALMLSSSKFQLVEFYAR